MERSRLDESWLPLRFESSNRLESNGVVPFSEPVLVTYIDLDRLIGEANLTRAEMRIIYFLMDGYSISDIAQRYGKARQTIDVLVVRAVNKICEADRRRWEETYV